MGLGSAATISLPEARERCGEARRRVAEGVSPIEARRTATAGALGPKTFGAVATELIDGLEAGWKNPKHRQQWRNTLTTHAASLWDRPVTEIGTDDVLKVLQPIWTRTPETASRTRGRIERVLDAAKARGFREGDNPARWRGHLALFLPNRRKSNGHHAAMPFAEIAEFIDELRRHDTTASLALEFTILTAARSGETLGACCCEMDLDRRIWTVPVERMKAGKPHRVPLSGPAIDLLNSLQVSDRDPDAFVFPGMRYRRPLSNMAMEMVLRRMKLEQYTVHGFRSTFRDWAGDETDFPREVIEAALAHTVGNQVERAYRRGDAFEKRRALMNAWGELCGSRHPESGTCI